MKAAFTGEPGQDWRLEKKPIEFVGIPGDCVGELTFVNDTEDKLKIRRLATQPLTDKRRKTPTLPEAEMAMQVRLQPQSSETARAVLKLDPTTAPGRYEVKLVYGDQSEIVQVEVLPNPGLAINPSHIKLNGASGDTLTFEVRFQNPGNVPMTVGDVGMIWFEERDWVGRNLVYSLRESAEGETYEEFANRTLKNFKESMVPPAAIQWEPAELDVLDPGADVVRTLSLTAPPGLLKGRTYLGFIKINSFRIWMELYCNGSPNSSKRR